ncbi:MAG: inorganic diphosphatase, partial [Chloroflexota bacterium]
MDWTAAEVPAFDVVVEGVGAAHNRYTYDVKARAVRLAEVVEAEHTYPADLGTISRSLGADGRPLSAILVVGQPTFPGCLVEARPIGLLELQGVEGGEQVVLAVPIADPRFADVRGIADLPTPRRKEIEDFVRE